MDVTFRATRVLGLLGILTAALAGCGDSAPPAEMPQAGPLEIRVLSNRADLLSGGDALVEIVNAGDGVRVDLDGTDISAAFARRASGRVIGRVEGLALGRNMLTARYQSRGARIALTHYPISGPIIAGAPIMPWDCTTEGQGLGAAEDPATCQAQTKYEYFYMPADGGQFQPYDPENPPSAVAQVTTDQGKTVPYIIRQETGTHNRGIYTIAVLFDPSKEWQPWAPQEGWNGKLHYPFGASCATVHSQGTVQNVKNDRALSRGFMVATSSLNELGHSCNTWLSAESVMMLKEHIVDHYGEIRYTMAEGCSGGSIGQHMVANMYPGLLQGIQPNCSFMDNWSTGLEVIDCHILLNYFSATSPQLWPAENQRAAVTGHASTSSCVAWEGLFAPVVDPEGGCFESDAESAPGAPDPRDYNAATNPTGCRGSVTDYNVSVLGKRPAELWDDSPSQATRDAEALVGGFARLGYGNVGVQYGLKALLDGTILAEQFVDLNEKVGTIDIDFNYMEGRREADTGSEVLYRAGGINDAGFLDQVAIIDLRGTSNAEIHTDYHSWGMRARLDKANGHHDNQLIWTFPSSLAVPPSVGDASFETLDRWLTAVEQDSAPGTLEQKVARNRPADAVDQCYIGDETAPPVRDPAQCAAAFPYFGSPRLVAGMAITHDNGSCQLKPLARSDYPDGTFSDAQWARLQAVFAGGVCDYSKPANLQQPTIPWLMHDGDGGVPLGDPPKSEAL